MTIDQSLGDRIATAVTAALQALPDVLAGWEGGSAAFGKVDAYSDIDLEYLVADDASFELLYAAAEQAIETVSPITASHTPLHDLAVERHGEVAPLFDKGDWLRRSPSMTGLWRSNEPSVIGSFRLGF